MPDQLTLARALSVPLVVVLFAWDFPNHDYWATAVFAVAMATDQVDGWLARRWNQTSAFGSLLDPIADKVLVMAALVMLIGEGVAPAWMVAAIIAREFLVSGLRLAAIERGVVIAARDLGKVKTWAQALAVVVGGLAAAGAWSSDIAWWVLLVAVVLTWISGLDYARVGAARAPHRPGLTARRDVAAARNRVVGSRRVARPSLCGTSDQSSAPAACPLASSRPSATSAACAGGIVRAGIGNELDPGAVNSPCRAHPCRERY